MAFVLLLAAARVTAGRMVAGRGGVAKPYRGKAQR
jgi:hypothetical protein